MSTSTTATALLHAHCGAPRIDECSDAPGTCWVCAAICGRSMPRHDWMTASFVGQNRARAQTSLVVCEPCVWAMRGRPPDTLRMYSHLLDAGAGEYLQLKSDKPTTRRWLRRRKVGPWFAAIADTGKKHVVPWAPVNPPGTYPGRVMFEEDVVELPRDDPALALIDRIAELLTAGSTKDEITRGEYGPGAWQRCGQQIRAFEVRDGLRLRHSRWFRLAIWLAQRDETAVAERMAREAEERRAKKREKDATTTNSRAVRRPARRDGARATSTAQRVPGDARGERPQALGPADRSPTGGGADIIQSAGVDHRDVPVAPAERAKPRQLTLLE